MVPALILLILLILLFGGLGIFVAKVFFLAMAVLFLISFLSGGYYMRRR